MCSCTLLHTLHACVSRNSAMKALEIPKSCEDFQGRISVKAHTKTLCGRGLRRMTLHTPFPISMGRDKGHTLYFGSFFVNLQYNTLINALCTDVYFFSFVESASFVQSFILYYTVLNLLLWQTILYFAFYTFFGYP